MSDSLRILIIGQGITGTALAFELHRRGVPFTIVDDAHKTAASMVHLACINPVTGRRYAKAWMIDDLLPLAQSAYAYAQQCLGKAYLSPADIRQIIPDDRIAEIWMLRTGDPEFTPYLSPDVSAFTHQGIREVRSAPILNGYHLNISAFLNDAAEWFRAKDLLISKVMDTDELDVDEGPVTWNDATYSDVVFCDGYRAAANPFFDWLELYPMKGEFLILRIPGIGLETHLKTNVSLIPLPEPDLYWLGSTYDRYEDDPAPTNTGREYLLGQVMKFLTADFSVEDHGVGIRATTRDRRPYIGTHPEYPHVHVITGMGTKGASLAPYCVKLMADALCEGKELSAEVNILRHAQR